ncbi:NAD(P)-binding protein [Lojkania enalia]|uniref:NAD(P)-binding protein n=1 Tax=Lojkania enalia TaxID=147567 RepID=A0A9P4K6A4_9PLEO|nr:NAD(P)-binding protein [Didymosphaeria enalia]
MPPTSQKSVLITGCSAGGIGSAVAFSFAKRGLLVFATARNISKIDPQLLSLSNVEVLTLDTTSTSSIRAAAQSVSGRTGGKLDYLVNNAGSGLVSPFLDTDMKKARALFEVNFWGVLDCIQEFKQLLVEAKGTIVNVSSIASRVPNPYESIYNASKAALSHFSHTLRLELAPLSIRVIILEVGMIKTSWYTNSMPSFTLPLNSLYTPATSELTTSVTGTENQKSGTPVAGFGEYIVGEVLKDGKTGEVWGGALSGTVRIVRWLPGWVMDNILWKKAGLQKIAEARKSG